MSDRTPLPGEGGGSQTEDPANRNQDHEERVDGGHANGYTERVDVKTRAFSYNVASDCRLRHHHRRVGKTVVSFVVQLEVRHPRLGTWLAVVRYDTVHGFAHRDQLHPDGRQEKTPLPIGDDNQALNYAEADLVDHWQTYRQRFLEEIAHEE